jgi:hypothetical protein
MVLKVLSLGAGVQSTTLALMANNGELGDVPDCAIFADTGWEPQSVYAHLEKLKQHLSFPVYTVIAGNLREDIINGVNSKGKRFASVPWHMQKANGTRAIGMRQCTGEYKIRPIQKKVVELMDGKRPKGGCEMWVGISTDEIFRMKPSRVKYIVNRWPLIEKRLNRNDCQQWLMKNGWYAPKSSCIGCPYHSNEQWRSLTKEEFDDAVKIDKAIRNQPKFKAIQFMHKSMIPLDEVDLRTDEEIGQIDLFNNECEGMCGV